MATVWGGESAYFQQELVWNLSRVLGYESHPVLRSLALGLEFREEHCPALVSAKQSHRRLSVAEKVSERPPPVAPYQGQW